MTKPGKKGNVYYSWSDSGYIQYEAGFTPTTTLSIYAVAYQDWPIANTQISLPRVRSWNYRVTWYNKVARFGLNEIGRGATRVIVTASYGSSSKSYTLERRYGYETEYALSTTGASDWPIPIGGAGVAYQLVSGKDMSAYKDPHGNTLPTQTPCGDFALYWRDPKGFGLGLPVTIYSEDWDKEDSSLYRVSSSRYKPQTVHAAHPVYTVETPPLPAPYSWLVTSLGGAEWGCVNMDGSAMGCEITDASYNEDTGTTTCKVKPYLSSETL